MVRIFLGMSKLNNVMLVAFIRQLLGKLGNSTFFNTPEVTIQGKVVGKLADGLEADYTSDKANKSGLVRGDRQKLERELPFLITMLEMLLTTSLKDEMECTILLEGIGLRLKGGKRTPGTRAFGVKAGATPDSVKLKAKGKAKVHQWHYTNDVDKFTNRIAMEPTTTATTEISNLKRGAYAFFHKAHVKGTTSVWEGPVYFVVAEDADQAA